MPDRSFQMLGREIFISCLVRLFVGHSRKEARTLLQPLLCRPLPVLLLFPAQWTHSFCYKLSVPFTEFHDKPFVRMNDQFFIDFNHQRVHTDNKA